MNALQNHWRAAASIGAILLFSLARIAGPPASYFGFAILLGWLAFLAWDQRDWLRARWAERFTRTEVDIERDIALADVAMDSAVGDQQNAKRLADWAGAVQHLEADLANPALPKHQRLSKERTLRVYRRSIADVTRAEQKRHRAATGQASPFQAIAGLSMPGVLPLVLGGLAFAIPAAWGAVQTFRLHATQQTLERAEDTAEHNADVARVLNDRLTAASLRLRVAADQAAATAHTVENERRLTAHFAAVERERNRAIQSVNAGGPPPSWRLRDDAGAAASDSPGGAGGAAVRPAAEHS